MGDCSLIRFFKMLKKWEILPKLVSCGGLRRLLVRLGQEYPSSDHSARRSAAATAIGAVQMLWTAEAVEDLKRLALQGKSASHISVALGVGSRKRGHRQGKPDRNQTERRGRLRAREGPASRASAQMGGADHSLPGRRATLRRRRRSRSPGLAGGTAGRRERALASSRSERCDGCGWRTFVTPPAGGRWAIRGAGILPIAGSRQSEASPIAPAIAKMAYRSSHARPIARERQGLRAIGEFMAAVVMRGATLGADLPLRLREHADETRSVRARFAPSRSGLDEEGAGSRPRALWSQRSAGHTQNRIVGSSLNSSPAQVSTEKANRPSEASAVPTAATAARGRRYKRAHPRRR